MPTCLNTIVKPQILTFQARYAAILNHRRTKIVRPAQDPGQDRMMAEIWHVGRLGEDLALDRDSFVETVNGPDGDVTPKRFSDIAGRSTAGWRKIGLVGDNDGDEESSHMAEFELFRDVGELGLECLVSHHLFRVHVMSDDAALLLNA